MSDFDIAKTTSPARRLVLGSTSRYRRELMQRLCIPFDVAAPDEPWHSGAEVGPELAAALATGAEKPERADDAFEYGLAVLLRGL